MSLKSGRVGVNPAYVNPVDGSILLPPSPPPENVYTKTECDDKFLSKTDASDMYLTQTSASNTYQSKLSADAWVTNTTVHDGAFTFSGLDDTHGWAFEPYVEITGNSVEKNPYATISSISGVGTINMIITYSTNADEGSLVKLRVIK